MCIGDWRLGRLMRHSCSTFSAGSGATLTFGQSPQRVAVGIYMAVVNTSIVHYTTVTFGSGLVVALGNTQSRFEPSFLTHGDLPMDSFILASVANGVACSVIEYFLPEEYIAAALESFRRDYMQEKED